MCIRRISNRYYSLQLLIGMDKNRQNNNNSMIMRPQYQYQYWDIWRHRELFQRHIRTWLSTEALIYRDFTIQSNTFHIFGITDRDDLSHEWINFPHRPFAFQGISILSYIDRATSEVRNRDVFNSPILWQSSAYGFNSRELSSPYFWSIWIYVFEKPRI